ncbi:putative immunoglobulin-blocking virulence protein [Mycoplasmopsis canis]|uniref:putative immunoglobulin-blocking virulence protein n=1 Tax=Mycoplasmopsis cynos TaxID=171284 RepID=UPI002AFF7541|nr:putative immunoglobulin-blocking virulence protein [Mycoplasmopsis cynos]WQQ13246.1 putative immunoglobulin-blocking virulence protein [Mycoplasmopsis cynos]WQQ13863.1 putative immunoglobulin-blocking virulence protein [Mycoplasmopsis cynos]
MKKMLNRKTKLALILVSTSVACSALSSGVIYNSIPNTTFSDKFSITSNFKKELISKNNLNLKDLNPSGADVNIKEIIIDKPLPKPEPKPNPVPVPEIKPELKPKPKPEPTPKVKEAPKTSPIPNPTPQPTPTPAPKPIPKPQLPKSTKQKITFENFSSFTADVTIPPDRIDSRDDIEKGITNPDGYKAEIVPDVNSVEVTEEHRNTTRENARGSLKKYIGIPFLKDKYTDDDYARLLNDGPNRDALINIIWKFRDLLLNGDKVYDFLTDEGKSKYQDIKKIQNQDVRFLRLITYIDVSKFNKLSDNAENNLSKGLLISKDESNVYINANGEIDSRAYSPISNKVTSRLQRDNKLKRVFGYDSYFKRNPDDVANGSYPGWTKTDVTSSVEYSKYNVSHSDGISITKLTRDKKDDKLRNEGIVVEIDAANPSGYSKTLKLIQELKNDGKEITSYRIKNIGKNDANQRFREIFDALPDVLPQLELFFVSQNTSALAALENKKIKELSLYTSENSLAEGWSLYPFALRNTSWVNTIDYNVSREYGYGVKVFTRITFDSLSFEDSDYDGTSYNRINDGLRMAYWTRNNEPIFQGGFGAGLHPDSNEGGNSYPLGLDLSRVTRKKTLRGLIFYDINKPSNTPRKLKRIVLYNNSENWNVDTDELNHAQFDVLSTQQPQMPRSKIIFSNGKETKKIRIAPTKEVSTLTSDGLNNLNILLNYSDGTFSNSTIIEVPKGATDLYNTLKGTGRNVQYFDPNQPDFDFS